MQIGVLAASRGMTLLGFAVCSADEHHVQKYIDSKFNFSQLRALFL